MVTIIAFQMEVSMAGVKAVTAALSRRSARAAG